MKYAELKQKNVKQLRALLLEQHKSLFQLRMRRHIDQLKQTHLLRTHRCDIARIETALHSLLKTKD